jgi:NADH-quinone oxidoreductase subunit N
VRQLRGVYPRVKAMCIEASIKYIVLTGTSSAILLFGTALIYNEVGTLEFAKIFTNFHSESVSLVILWAGSALLLVGVGFKLALFPFHIWAPDV